MSNQIKQRDGSGIVVILTCRQCTTKNGNTDAGNRREACGNFAANSLYPLLQVEPLTCGQFEVSIAVHCHGTKIGIDCTLGHLCAHIENRGEVPTGLFGVPKSANCTADSAHGKNGTFVGVNSPGSLEHILFRLNPRSAQTGKGFIGRKLLGLLSQGYAAGQVRR